MLEVAPPYLNGGCPTGAVKPDMQLDDGYNNDNNNDDVTGMSCDDASSTSTPVGLHNSQPGMEDQPGISDPRRADKIALLRSATMQAPVGRGSIDVVDGDISHNTIKDGDNQSTADQRRIVVVDKRYQTLDSRRSPGRNAFSSAALDSLFFLQLEVDSQLRETDDALKRVGTLRSSSGRLKFVNDDAKYPNAVTPSKVETTTGGAYNVPFIDDEAFYYKNWYVMEDNRWSRLESNAGLNDNFSQSEIQLEKACIVEGVNTAPSLVKKKRRLPIFCGCVNRK